jgi:phospholipase D-like protein
MNQAEVYPRLLDDFTRAKERIVIYSPFLTNNRLGQVLPHLRAAVERGVDVYVFTKAPEPPDRRKSELASYRAMEDQLASAGVTVIHKPRMHEKLVFVDGDIAWTGSLNVLSFRNTEEWMGRWKSQRVVEDFSRPLNLDNILGIYKCRRGALSDLQLGVGPRRRSSGPLLAVHREGLLHAGH